jgi:cell division cycle 2-like
MKLRYWMPYIPYSLRDLLASTALSPHPLISFSSPPTTTTPRETRFVLLVKSFTYQILCALAFLHNGRGIRQGVIAHRDIKPSNILLKPDGLVVLIDFGVAWVEKGEGVDVDRTIDVSDLWPEGEEKMYFEVATG